MQKTKVVIIHNIVSPHVTKLFQELSDLVYLTVLYCAVGEENRSWKERIKGFNHKVLNNFSIKFKGNDLFTYFINTSILKEISCLKPDVVIIAGWDLFAYQVAFLYCKINKIKIIIWSGSTEYEKSWRRSLSLPLVRAMITHADAFIAYGRRAKRYLVKNGANANKIFIYNHTTDIEKYKVKRKSNISELNILYYGQLIERKGVDILVKSFSNLVKKNSRLKLTIVGSGQYRPRLDCLINDLQLKESVTVIDDPGDDKIQTFFSDASLFVLPSREEVWGLVINEAMAAGLPVIVSSAAGSTEELVKDGVNGYVFKSGSATQLTEKIKRVVADPGLMKSMRRESLRIITNFTPRSSAEIMAQAVRYVTKH